MEIPIFAIENKIIFVNMFVLFMSNYSLYFKFF